MASSVENSVSTASGGEVSVSSSGNQATPTPPETTKRKRNLPGMPDPNAEVISLSPKTLMATNRFICEVCGKGFQRDQNLQLHRRGHNLPWKLRQRASKEIRKRVYVCPVNSCIHHDPARALGDLTGIKKHFCRKHGEKKWNCDKCGKKYAVLSDWKAHIRTCGSKEYRCDCGTVFSRRDSFVTHRAFCEALAEEASNSKDEDKSPPPGDLNYVVPISAIPPVETLGKELSEVPATKLQNTTRYLPVDQATACGNGSSSVSNNGSNSNSMVSSVFSPPSVGANLQPQSSAFSDLVCAMTGSDRSTPEAKAGETLLCLSSNTSFSLFGSIAQDGPQFARPAEPALSATALLQKAAEIGAAASTASLFGFGISVASSSGQQESLQWNHNEIEPRGLGLGLSSSGGRDLTELMMEGPSWLLGPRPPTHDFLGLGMANRGGPSSWFSALNQSMGGIGDLNDAAAAVVASSSDAIAEDNINDR